MNENRRRALASDELITIREELEKSLADSLRSHNYDRYIALFQSNLVENHRLAWIYGECISHIKSFITEPTNVNRQALQCYHENEMLKYVLAYYIFGMKKVTSHSYDVHARSSRSTRTQCSEFMELVEAGVIIDHHLGMATAVRCSNIGPYFVKAEALNSSKVYLWTRLDINWSYTGDEKIRIDITNDVIDFGTLSYHAQQRGIPATLWWHLFVSIYVYVENIDLNRYNNVKLGFLPQKSCFFNENFWHIGHEVWNNFSAADFFERHGQKFDLVIGYKEQCLHGDQHKIFSRISDNIVLLDDMGSLVKYFAQNPEVITFMVRHDFISQRISSHVRENLGVRQDFSVPLPKRKEGDITVAFGIRCGNRECLNALELLVALVEKTLSLSHRGKLFVVLDGTQRTNQAGTHAFIATDKETLLLKQMHNQFSGHERVEIFDTADMTYPESVATVNSCDLFVSPWGAGLVKTCWVGRLPGLIYGNRFILSKSGDYDLYSSDFWVEEPNTIIYLRLDSVLSDYSRSDDGKLNDYEIDTVKFTEDYCELLEKCNLGAVSDARVDQSYHRD